MVSKMPHLPLGSGRSIRLLVIWILLPFAAVADFFGATILADGYAVRVWQTDDGLPQNLVTAAAQTSDGFLWFGTSNGLARFDGKRFRVFNTANTPALADRRVSSLFADEEGSLWIGLETGDITRYGDGRFEAFSSPPFKESEAVIGIGSDETGRVWAMRQNGALDCLDDGSRISSLISPDRPGIMNWSRSSDGSIWLGENGTAAYLGDQELTPIELGAFRSDTYVVGIAAAKGGGAWILCDDRVRKWKDGVWIEDLGDYPWGPRSAANCLELSDGTLAVGTISHGLYLFFRDGRPPVHFDVDKGLPQNWVRFVFEDSEGTLWIGAGSAGLVSIHATAFSVVTPPEPWENSTVLSVAEGSGESLWIGTDGAGLFRYASGDWTRYAGEEGLGNPYLQSVVEDDQGKVWACHFWWGGPFLLKNGRFDPPSSVDPSWSPAMALLPIPGTDRLLVGNRDGLLELDEQASRWLMKSPEGKLDDANALAIDGSGAIWCGFARGGLVRIAGETVTHFREGDGLASDSIHCLLADDDGSLWIGSADSGLSRFKDGAFSNISVAQGLADNAICSMLDDGLGNYWLSTFHGIQRVSKETLNACADGSIPVISSQVYDRNDGLPIVEFAGGRQAAATRTGDGQLYFASSKGVLRVDPASIEPNLYPPPVVVDTLLVDGETTLLQTGMSLGQLAPDHQRIEFRYAGLSYVAPNKVRFKYRLDGIDKDWIEAGTERAAFYSRLPAGDYRFRVIARNNDGVWNEEGAMLAFSVAPFFWATWWFVSICILITLVVVALSARYITRRRLQAKIRDMERQHAVERERTRIAQDIHDDVGASLSRIAMLSQPSRYKLVEPERAPVLVMINSTARKMTDALDEIVWAVNPRHDTIDSLADYIGRFAQSFLASADVQCRLDIPFDVPARLLTAEVRHNLFLAFKEALNNTVKHAGASEVKVRLSFHSNRLELVVKDNGRGFDVSSVNASAAGRVASGNGLWNLRERLRCVGGSFEVESEKGVGTTVTFTVQIAG